MTKKKPEYFRVIYRDHDKKTFNVSGIVSDDLAVTDRTHELQNEGRCVNIETTNSVPDREKVPSVVAVSRQIPADYIHDPSLSW